MSSLFIAQFVETWIYVAAIAFARIGTATILLPGFGEGHIPARFKIAFGVILTLGLLPALPIPDPPQTQALLFMLIAFEITIGVFIGVGARLILYAMHIVGAQIGFAAGLSNAILPNQSNNESGSAIAALLTTGAVALMFATDMHHLVLSGLLRSYTIMPPGRLMPGDLADQIARLGGGAFYIAAAMGAPFFILSLLVNLGLGLANRVMPAMQVFFVASPGLIIIGLFALMLAAPAIMEFQVVQMADWFQYFVR